MFINRTFACKTLQERLPKVLTQIIDTLHQYEPIARKQYGDVSMVVNNMSLPNNILFQCTCTLHVICIGAVYMYLVFNGGRRNSEIEEIAEMIGIMYNLI